MNPISTYRPFGQPANGTVIVNLIPLAGATVTVAGTVYTYGTDFAGESYKNKVAESLAAAINADRGYLDETTNRSAVKSVYAFNMGNTVAIIATVPGTAGNSLGLATSDSVSFTVSGATLSGGTSTTISVDTSGAVITAATISADIPVITAGTRVQFPNLLSVKVHVSAHGDNVGDVYIGDVTVTKASGSKRGITLSQYGTYTFEIPNANLLYVNADNNGDAVSILVTQV